MKERNKTSDFYFVFIFNSFVFVFPNILHVLVCIGLFVIVASIPLSQLASGNSLPLEVVYPNLKWPTEYKSKRNRKRNYIKRNQNAIL